MLRWDDIAIFELMKYGILFIRPDALFTWIQPFPTFSSLADHPWHLHFIPPTLFRAYS